MEEILKIVSSPISREKKEEGRKETSDGEIPQMRMQLQTECFVLPKIHMLQANSQCTGDGASGVD